MYAVVLTILPSLSFLYTATVFAFIGVFCMIYSELFISLMFREIRPCRFLIAINILAKIKKWIQVYRVDKCNLKKYLNITKCIIFFSIMHKVFLWTSLWLKNIYFLNEHSYAIYIIYYSQFNEKSFFTVC